MTVQVAATKKWCNLIKEKKKVFKEPETDTLHFTCAEAQAEAAASSCLDAPVAHLLDNLRSGVHKRSSNSTIT